MSTPEQTPTAAAERFIILTIDPSMDTTLWSASAAGDVSDEALEQSRAEALRLAERFDDRDVVVARIVTAYPATRVVG